MAALPFEEYRRLVPHLQPATLPLGKIIYEPGGYSDHVYFPTSAVVSLLYTMMEGSTAEVGLAGNDGMVGVAVFLGGLTSPHRAIVQIGGGGFKMQGHILREEFARSGPFHDLLLRYTQALMTQISQTAACNRLHSIEKRLCRWLLLCRDRVHSDEIVMTQEFISNMLGGRRETVTLAAGRLQDAGLIHYARGHIRILNRPGIEAVVCECYRIVRDESERLLGASRYGW